MQSDQTNGINASSNNRTDNTDDRDIVTCIKEGRQIQDKTENNNNYKEVVDHSKGVDVREKLRESLLTQKVKTSTQPQPGSNKASLLPTKVPNVISIQSAFKEPGTIVETAATLRKPGTIVETTATLRKPGTIVETAATLREPGAIVETTSTLINQTILTNNTIPSEVKNKSSIGSVKNIKTNQVQNIKESILAHKQINLIQESVSILHEPTQQKYANKESMKSNKTQMTLSQVKVVEPKKPNGAGGPPRTGSTALMKDSETEKITISMGTDQKQSPLKPAFRDSTKPLYVNAAQKLPSVGPLTIHDMDEFLKKSKIDFEHFYHVKSVSNYQIADFNLKKTLGIGAFGRVVLGEFKKDKTLYALKVIDKQIVVKKNYIKYVSNEKRILQGLNFPFVISLKYFFTDFYYLYLVMPYVPGGNFFKRMRICKKITESDAKFYIGQLVLALEYLHYLELIHRDVKLENIMIDAFGYLKLVDFGQCIRCYGVNKTFTLTGTPEYMAPEIIVGKGYDCAVDWWALGIITFEMCAGFRPFKDENVRKLHLLILCSRYTIPNEFSSSLKKFIEGLLAQEPTKRIANHSKKALLIKKHVWFKGMNWLALLNRSLEAPSLPTNLLVPK